MKLSILKVSKRYKNVQALRSVSLELEPGVYGLLGPNGAGKSTLIKIITGNLHSSQGAVFYNGKSIHRASKEYKKSMGYVPQVQGMYDSFTAGKFLEYIAVLKEIKTNQIEHEVERVLRVVGLADVKERKLGGFSGGMRQRVLIAQALLGNPEIVILDEPTAGLDPKERIKIRNFISKIAGNKIILIATHVVSDVETIAKEIILLSGGKVMQKGSPKMLCENLNGKVWKCTLSGQQCEMLGEHLLISNRQEKQHGNIEVRIVAEERDINILKEEGIAAESVFPNLQEVYLSTVAGKR